MGRRKVMDQAFCDRARRLAEVHQLQVVAEILKTTPSQITRIKKRGWKAADHASMRRRMPDDFQVRQSTMSWSELIAHYRVGAPTLSRWFRQLRALGKARESWRGDSLRRNPRREAAAAPVDQVAQAASRTHALLKAAGAVLGARAQKDGTCFGKRSARRRPGGGA